LAKLRLGNIGNGTRDLPASSAVPQPTAQTRPASEMPRGSGGTASNTHSWSRHQTQWMDRLTAWLLYARRNISWFQLNMRLGGHQRRSGSYGE